jgi:HK97 family phage major capsid protein
MPPVLDRLHDERTSLLDQVDSITNAAEGDDRDLSSAEQELIDRCHNRIADEIDPQLERLERIERTRSEHNRAVLPHVAGAANGTTGAPITPPGSGEVVYRTFAEYARDVLIVRYDQLAQRAGLNARAAAADRIERVVANTLTTDVPGLIRPQYMDQIVQVIDASRPIVDSARKVGLNSGTLTYPSITQRPIVGKQTTEKTETASQKMTVVFVNVTADTYAGSGDLSWQAINWSTPNALELWFTLAAEQYALQTEAATGTVLAAATVMATPAIPATPTLADWMTAITAASGVIYTASRRRPDTVYADVTTGYSIMGLVSNVAPVFIPTGGFSLSSGTGTIAGLRLVISSGLPAKTVVVGDSQSLLAAETPGAPVELRAVEPAIGGMEVGVIGAFVSKITDAGAFRKLTIP